MLFIGQRTHFMAVMAVISLSLESFNELTAPPAAIREQDRGFLSLHYILNFREKVQNNLGRGRIDSTLVEE